MDTSVVPVVVVMPCYNAERTVTEAVQSALAQTHTNLQLWCVDDGSSDASPRILADLARRDGRMRLLRQRRAGPYAARNLAIRSTDAPFLAFLDADDIWKPQKLAHQLDLLARDPSSHLCHTAANVIDRDGVKIGDLSVSPKYLGDAFRQLLVRNGIVLSSTVVRRAAFDTVGLFSERYSACADWEMWIRIARRFPIAGLHEILVDYRTHPDNISSDLDRVSRNHAHILDDLEHSYGSDPELDAVLQVARGTMWKMYAMQYYVSGNHSLSRKCLAKALRYGQIDPTLLGCFAKSLLPAPVAAWARRAARLL